MCYICNGCEEGSYDALSVVLGVFNDFFASMYTPVPVSVPVPPEPEPEPEPKSWIPAGTGTGTGIPVVPCVYGFHMCENGGAQNLGPLGSPQVTPASKYKRPGGGDKTVAHT